ncbi:HlyD family efflux transporter periplasmic adaptor subunit [Thalassotalea sp. G2M2-11]|uniref:HlyD family secretion protein n=1 Tax=Thalassotalea sp. G2M2-11 TaxID=2787627 RepID=UPI0019D21F95|nr:HlyD family efflux transporter periplasmic adaptor subunit [Thalassotalea sp. G2M2-11]
MRSCLTFFLLLLAANVYATPSYFILSGQIKASENQAFYAPKTDTWRVQVQWMIPEGEVANKGDLVVVFDSGSMQSLIEQEEVSLIAAKEELHRLERSHGQSILEATYKQKKTALLLEKARIDAGISSEHLSQYDFEKNQLELEKAVVNNSKAIENLKQVKVAATVAKKKQELKILQHQNKLTYHQNKLKNMSLRAQRTGPVLYGNHPWNGEKVFVGMTAQPSWKIAEIPSMNGLFIEAWVHEVDYKNLQLNQVAKLSFDAFPDIELTAELVEISTQPEKKKEWGKGVYYRTVFDFEVNEKMTLLPGMSAQLEFAGAADE